MFASLSSRGFRYLWIANLCATFAMQMAQVARGWLIYAMTGSSVQLAWVMLSFLAPTIVLSLPGGVLADRVDKKRILVLAQALNCVSTLLLAIIVYRGGIAFWHFIAFGLFNGSILALSMPARQSVIPEIVGERLIFNAMSLSSASMNLSRVLGPAVAGVLIAWLADGDTASARGVGIVFFLIAALYGVASAATLGMGRAGRVDGRRHGSVGTEVREGLIYIWRAPVLRALVVLAFATLLFGMPMQFLMPAFNEDALDGGPDDLGLLMSAMGVGAITGSLLLARMGEARHKGWLMLAAALAWAVAAAWFAHAPDVGAALPLAALTGLFSALFTSMNNSLIQLAVDREMRGRVMSMVMMIWGLMPLGVLPVSFLAEAIGISAALELSAIALALLTFASIVVLPEIRRIDTGYRAADPVHDAVSKTVSRSSA
ncbi:MAG: MFS transporter [Pseudomonadales bacterium]|jgi:MFS family permease|nr:MFS transporter [Pseudomonadales bacterium]